MNGTSLLLTTRSIVLGEEQAAGDASPEVGEREPLPSSMSSASSCVVSARTSRSASSEVIVVPADCIKLTNASRKLAIETVAVDMLGLEIALVSLAQSAENETARTGGQSVPPGQPTPLPLSRLLSKRDKCSRYAVIR